MKTPDSMLQPLCAPGRVVFTTVGIGPSWLRVPAAHEAVSDAREFTVERLSGCADDFLDDAALVTSELVTNAIRYAIEHEPPPRHVAPGIWLGVQNEPTYAHLRVRDPYPEPPAPRTAAETDVSGRGLHIVAALAAVSWVDLGRFDKTLHAVIAKPGVVLTRDEIRDS